MSQLDNGIGPSLSLRLGPGSGVSGSETKIPKGLIPSVEQTPSSWSLDVQVGSNPVEGLVIIPKTCCDLDSISGVWNRVSIKAPQRLRR